MTCIQRGRFFWHTRYIDKHEIEVIYLEKKWNAGRIVKEFPSKGWKKSTVHDLIKKIEETGSSDRRPGSGRPRTVSFCFQLAKKVGLSRV